MHNLSRGKPAFVVLWVLAGSSLHKTYPHMDDVIANIVEGMPDSHVIFIGDELCQILEAGWENIRACTAAAARPRSAKTWRWRSACRA